jgi:hypothetical protein
MLMFSEDSGMGSSLGWSDTGYFFKSSGGWVRTTGLFEGMPRGAVI